MIIVTGAGRSGTSAVARVLHESGLSMGQDFGEPSEFNPLGFYEELAVRSLNEQMMADSGMKDLERWPERPPVIAAADNHRETMNLLVANAGAGWKDPRFCLTLEAWLPHFTQLLKVVVCLRSPEAFVHSVVGIFGPLPREVLEQWWANHLQRLLDVIRAYHLDATCVVYEDLVEKPEATVKRLSSFVGHELDATFVEPSLQQFSQRVPDRHMPLYDKVRSLA